MPSCALYVFMLFILTITSNAASEDPIAQTTHGTIKGTYMVSRSGRNFYAFRGIPYAKSPTGKFRFKNPQPPDSWTDIYLTQKDAPACLQKNYLFGKTFVEGSEDCLYLNVYTHNLNSNNARRSVKSQLLPVMVFIHWGGFFTGYSSSNYLGPEYFMDKNVVLVTFNYRLGVLGFLSTFDDAAPGNYGLKDQTAALQWVQENIHNFGGNKNEVTLFGQSAGGASVHFHMFNTQSRGLFHRAISESGTGLALWAKPVGKEQVQIARIQATLVGCKDAVNDTMGLVDCLRNVDAAELVNTGDTFKFFSIDPLTVYLPSIEKTTEDNPHPFLTKDPTEYIKSGDFYNVPWILGTVGDEGIIRAAPLTLQPETLKILNRKFNQLMPNLMALFMSTPKEQIEVVWKKIRQRYFGGHSHVDIHNRHSIQGLIDLYTDRSFAYTVFQTALLHWKHNHKQIWMYSFNYRGEHSYGQLFAGTENNLNYKWGVSHCDELLYLFKSPAIFEELRNSNDISMSKILVTLWTNFAIHGHPTPDYDHTQTEKWLTVKDNATNFNMDKNLHFLNVTGNYQSSMHLDMEYGFYKENFKFWEELPLVENIDTLNQTHVDLQ